MINRKTLLMIIVILLITMIIFALFWNHVKVRKAQENTRQMEILLSYIEEHNGAILDYTFVSENLGIPRKQIFKLLLQLEQKGKIRAQQQFLRKPVLLSDNDYANYFWIVSIASD